MATKDQNSNIIQLFTFVLNEEVFALEINNIREVLEYTSITKIPNTPEIMKGIINLRGSVVPVIDMKLKFNMGETKRTVGTCIIIIEILIDDRPTLIGALVDSVEEVLELSSDQIEPAPKIGAQFDSELIKGMGKHDGNFIIILDMEKTFSLSEIDSIKESNNKLSA